VEQVRFGWRDVTICSTFYLNSRHHFDAGCSAEYFINAGYLSTRLNALSSVMNKLKLFQSLVNLAL
jgi:hypothetical protein